MKKIKIIILFFKFFDNLKQFVILKVTPKKSPKKYNEISPLVEIDVHFWIEIGLLER